MTAGRGCMKIALSELWALERMFWKKLNGFTFFPNKTLIKAFLNCINASWKLVCGFLSQTDEAPNFISHAAATPDFQNQIGELVLDFILQSSCLCTVFSGNKLLLQLQIQEGGSLLVLTFMCLYTNCKAKRQCVVPGLSYWRNFTFVSSSLILKEWEMLQRWT